MKSLSCLSKICGGLDYSVTITLTPETSDSDIDYLTTLLSFPEHGSKERDSTRSFLIQSRSICRERRENHTLVGDFQYHVSLSDARL